MEPLVEVASGFSSTVYRTHDGRCLKVAHDPEVAVRHRREIALMGAVVGRLPVEVQWPARVLPASARWPYGALLCPWLVGNHLTAADSPAPVAAFLHSLATVPAEAVAGLVEPYERWWSRQRQSVSDGIAALDGRVDQDVASWLRWFEAAFETVLAPVEAPSFVHGDLWAENMLARDGVLTGVVDWEFAALADPAADLSGLWYLDDGWREAVLAELGWPAAAVLRGRYYWVARELYGAAWAVRHRDARELSCAVTKATAAVRAAAS